MSVVISAFRRRKVLFCTQTGAYLYWYKIVEKLRFAADWCAKFIHRRECMGSAMEPFSPHESATRAFIWPQQ